MSFNNGPRTVVTGLSLLVDAADPLSYPGSGTSWTDIVTGITGSLSGSITYASDFKGTLVVNNSSSVIIFPTSSGNFGTDSFTVELAFQPNQINGQHWLVAKNSGSFPSWGAFITGSSGSGRITAFFNVSSTISCSMSTPTGSIVTGSNYLVDINFLPNASLNTIYLNSELSGSIIPNGTGSLSATSSLFISNRNSGSSVGTSLEIFNTKLYTPRLVPGMIRQNYNSLSTRLGLSQKLSLPILEDGLLNLYPGAAAAYSLRSLNSDYGGAAIQVRRSSDNAVLDIGFTSNGDLDTIALLAHCGADNGFVTTWYDQSGNGRNAVNTTAANQPQIVSSGSVLTTNGKPAIKWSGGSNYWLRTALFSTISQPVTAFITAQCDSVTSNALVDGGATNGQFLIFRSSTTNMNYNMGATITDTSVSNSQLLFSVLGNTSSSEVYNNNVLEASGNIGTNVVQSFTLGNLSVGLQTIGFQLKGALQEFVFYPSNQSTNLSAINTNINTYYGIY
jgi:hypothetical protein